MDYGLWLLIGLLIVIGLIFLLSGKGSKAADSDAPQTPFVPAPPVAPIAAMPVAIEPVAVEPVVVVEPVAVEPLIVEPIEAVTAPEPTPVPVSPAPISRAPESPVPISPAATAAPDAGDDLLRLKGVGPKLRTLLIELGVTRYAQIAAWTDTDLATIDAKLGTFKGRPVRDQWIDQAKYLAAGDIAGFEAKYGKI